MKIVLSSLFLISLSLFSQDSISKPKLNFEVYGDFFINGTFNNQPSHKISDIIYNHNRTNEFAINLAYLKSSYIDTNFRFNLALMAGTYSEDNLATEDNIFKHIFEANAGYKISKNSNTWIDLGVMNSHIGWETAVAYDAWTISRTLLAENVPFYETGIKLTHTTKDEKFSHSYMLLNGWQRITMIQGNSIPALGMQFTYKPNKKSTFNYSNFIGSVRPDSLWALRTYHNFYVFYDLSSKLSLFADFDIGSDKNSQDNYGLWYGGILKLRYKLGKGYSMTYRADFIEDANDILYPEMKLNWFAWTNSINIDKKLNSYSLIRAELKYLNSSEQLFLTNHSDYLGIFLALQIKI